MANKVLKNLNDWMRWFNEGRCTAQEVLDKEKRFVDLIYDMWQEDLISDKVKDECYKVLSDFAWKNDRILLEAKHNA